MQLLMHFLKRILFKSNLHHQHYKMKKGKSENAGKLKLAIATLEEIRDKQRTELKLHFEETFDSLKPLNIIKNSFKSITHSPDLKNQFVDSGIGIASGVLVKNILFRSTHNPIKKIGVVMLQALITNLAAKNSDKIKSAGISLLSTILKARKNHKRKVFSENEIYD